jgi:hypothetical protein
MPGVIINSQDVQFPVLRTAAQQQAMHNAQCTTAGNAQKQAMHNAHSWQSHNA